MIVYLSNRTYAARHRQPLSLRGAAGKGGDVAISRQEVTNQKMFDEWFVLVGTICYSASVIVPLYQEIAAVAVAPSQ